MSLLPYYTSTHMQLVAHHLSFSTCPTQKWGIFDTCPAHKWSLDTTSVIYTLEEENWLLAGIALAVHILCHKGTCKTRLFELIVKAAQMLHTLH